MTTIDQNVLANLTNVTDKATVPTNHDIPQNKQDTEFDLYNMQLQPLDNDDDDILIDFLNKNPQLEAGISVNDQPMSSNTVQNVQNIKTSAPHLPFVVPKCTSQIAT